MPKIPRRLPAAIGFPALYEKYSPALSAPDGLRKIKPLYSQWGLLPRPLVRFELATPTKMW
jgi:hypothetical protein